MARRFRFSLEAVSKVRSAAEREQQRLVAGIRRELLVVEGEMERALAERMQLGRESRSMRQAVMLDVAALRQRQLYSGWLDQRVAELTKQRDGIEERLSVARDNLIAAVKQRKAIDKLRERQWARHQAEVLRVERSAMDEVAAVGFSRRTEDQQETV